MKTLFLILLFQTTFSSKVYAASCKSFTSISENHVLKVILEAEKVVVELSKMHQTHPEMSTTVSRISERLASGIENSLTLDFSDLDQIKYFSTFEKRVASLSQNTVAIVGKVHSMNPTTSTLDPVPKSKQQPNWLEIAYDPSMLQPETVYTVQKNNGLKIDILFSTKVIEKVFRSNDSFFIEASKKSLKSLTNTTDTGLLLIPYAKDVFKIKHLGRTGSFRFYGYIHEDTYHVVHWSNEATHDTSNIGRAVDKTRRARLSRRH